MTITRQPRLRAPMRQVNDAMWESLGQGGYSEPIAFFCECADERCYQAVWLTGEDYARARAEPHWSALHEGHVGAALGADGWHA
jgi:hypothetical protein